MKRIYLNLKRFDVPIQFGGVNGLTDISKWGKYIIDNTKNELEKYADKAKFAMFFPELHILNAVEALGESSVIKIGCQSVYREDTAVAGNFGAFTSNRTAGAMSDAGVLASIIGHCEERKDKNELFALAGNEDRNLVNKVLNKEIKVAIDRGLDVLYCIGENESEMSDWEAVLGAQLDIGLEGVDKKKVVIAYEPIWSIGPGKTPAGKDYITKVAKFVKEKTGGMEVVYGGGLKADNAKMLASIDEIDGGLIALTRFSGQIGFYPDEYLEIIRLYLGE